MPLACTPAADDQLSRFAISLLGLSRDDADGFVENNCDFLRLVTMSFICECDRSVGGDFEAQRRDRLPIDDDQTRR